MYIHNTYTVCRSELLTLIGVAKQYLKVKHFFIIMKAICFEITKKIYFLVKNDSTILVKLASEKEKRKQGILYDPTQ